MIHLEHPAPYLLELLAFSVFYPVNQKIASSNPEWAYSAGPNFVSNGPFNMTKWDHESEIVMEKNPLYWDASSVKLNTVNLAMIADTLTEFYLFESGELDFAGAPLSNLPADILLGLEKEGKLEHVPFSAIYYYKINNDHFPLHNVNIRKGLAYCIDRQAIVEHVMQVGHRPATSFVPPLYDPFFNRERGLIKITDDMAEKGRVFFEKGLKEEGLTPSQFPELTLFFNSNREHQKVAEAIQQQWKEHLGINIVLEQADWKVYLNRMEKQDYEIARAAWVGEFSDPIAFLIIFNTNSPDGNNQTGWSHSHYTHLLEKSHEELDPFKRSELLLEAEELLIEHMPIIPIYYIEGLCVKSPHLNDVVITSCGSIDFKWAYFH